MSEYDPERLRVRKSDAERLLTTTLAMATLTCQRMEECRQRAADIAVLAQKSRARIRTSMWLAHSRG